MSSSVLDIGKVGVIGISHRAFDVQMRFLSFRNFRVSKV